MVDDYFKKHTDEWRADLKAYLAQLQKEIGDEYRADDEDDDPSMLVTIASDDALHWWVSQTGDTSFMGACYGKPHWGQVALYRDSDLDEAVDALIDGLYQTWGE